jgi:hypothetical protein
MNPTPLQYLRAAYVVSKSFIPRASGRDIFKVLLEKVVQAWEMGTLFLWMS